MAEYNCWYRSGLTI